MTTPFLMNDQPALPADAFIVPEEALCLVPEPLCHGMHPRNGAVLNHRARIS
jgi:hypothetical protein